MEISGLSKTKRANEECDSKKKGRGNFKRKQAEKSSEAEYSSDDDFVMPSSSAKKKKLTRKQKGKFPSCLVQPLFY